MAPKINPRNSNRCQLRLGASAIFVRPPILVIVTTVLVLLVAIHVMALQLEAKQNSNNNLAENDQLVFNKLHQHNEPIPAELIAGHYERAEDISGSFTQTDVTTSATDQGQAAVGGQIRANIIVVTVLSEQDHHTFAPSTIHIATGIKEQLNDGRNVDHGEQQQQQQQQQDQVQLQPQPQLQQTTNASTPNAIKLTSATEQLALVEDDSQKQVIQFPLYMRIIATIACIIILAIGVTGNLLVPLVVIKTKDLRNSTNLFLINLSVADVLVLIVCMPTVLVELHSKPETWLLGEQMCKMTNFVEMLAANGSILTILAISFERYYAICKPLKAGYKCTKVRAAIIIFIVWFLAVLLTSPIIAMAKLPETTYIDGSLVHNCILETKDYWHKTYVFVSMIAFFWLPLIVLMLVYWLIAKRLFVETTSAKSMPTLYHHHHHNGHHSSIHYQPSNLHRICDGRFHSFRFGNDSKINAHISLPSSHVTTNGQHDHYSHLIISSSNSNSSPPTCMENFSNAMLYNNSQQMKSRRQVVVMLAFVIACFFLLFFPYRIFTIWLIFSTEDQVQSLGMETYYNLTYFSRILIYLHSAINPIAYNLISTKFRRAFIAILCCRDSNVKRKFTTEYRASSSTNKLSTNYSRQCLTSVNQRNHSIATTTTTAPIAEA